MRERAEPSVKLEQYGERPSRDVRYADPSPFETGDDSEDEENYPQEMEYDRYIGECSVQHKCNLMMLVVGSKFGEGGNMSFARFVIPDLIRNPGSFPPPAIEDCLFVLRSLFSVHRYNT